MALDNKFKARVDAGAKTLWKLKQEAEEGAVEMCEAGQMELSAGLYRVAAKLQEAYAEGRLLRADGEFVALGGGK